MAERHDHRLGHRNWAAGQELPCAIIVMANAADRLMLFDDTDCSEGGGVFGVFERPFCPW